MSKFGYVNMNDTKDKKVIIINSLINNAGLTCKNEFKNNFSEKDINEAYNKAKEYLLEFIQYESINQSIEFFKKYINFIMRQEIIKYLTVQDTPYLSTVNEARNLFK